MLRHVATTLLSQQLEQDSKHTGYSMKFSSMYREGTNGYLGLYTALGALDDSHADEHFYTHNAALELLFAVFSLRSFNRSYIISYERQELTESNVVCCMKSSKELLEAEKEQFMLSVSGEHGLSGVTGDTGLTGLNGMSSFGGISGPD